MMITPNLHESTKNSTSSTNLNLDALVLAVYERNRASASAHVVTDILCPLCDSTVKCYEQPAVFAGRAPYTYYYCTGDDCPGASAREFAGWLDVVLPVNAGVKGAA